MEKINYKLINFLLIIITIFFISKSIDIYKDIIFLILETLFPIFLSFFISYSLYPCTRFINKKFSYNISCFIVFLICFITITSLIYVLIPVITKEVSLFSDNILDFVSNLSFLESEFSNYLKSFLSIESGINIINTGASFITKLIIVIVLSIYFLLNMPKIKSYLNKYELFRLIDKDLFNYYKGFYLVIIIEIIEYLIIYFIIGHPNFMLIALLSGITSVIPFFGALFTNLLALITSINASKTLFIMTAITMIVVPLFNSYIIEPRIYNKTLKVSLIGIIISCFIFGYIFGFFGILFAIPFFLVIKNLFMFFLLGNKKV